MAHRADLCRAFKMLHLIRALVLSLSHPFQAVPSQKPHRCYGTPSGCLVPQWLSNAVLVQQSLTGTVSREDNSLWLLYFKAQHLVPIQYKTQCEWGRSRELKTDLIRYSSLRKKCCWLISVRVWAIHWSCPPVLEVNADKLQHFHILRPVILNSSLSWAPMPLVAALTSFL